MDRGDGVRGGEQVGDLIADREDLGDFERPVAPQPMGERFALEELHDQIEPIAAGAEVVDFDRRGVTQGRGYASFALKASLGLGVGEGGVGPEDLDGYRAIQHAIAGAVYQPHAALAEQ